MCANFSQWPSVYLATCKSIEQIEWWAIRWLLWFLQFSVCCRRDFVVKDKVSFSEKLHLVFVFVLFDHFMIRIISFMNKEYIIGVSNEVIYVIYVLCCAKFSHSQTNPFKWIELNQLNARTNANEWSIEMNKNTSILKWCFQGRTILISTAHLLVGFRFENIIQKHWIRFSLQSVNLYVDLFPRNIW